MPPRTRPGAATPRFEEPHSSPLAEVPRWVWFASVAVIAGAAAILALLSSSGSGRPSTAQVKAVDARRRLHLPRRPAVAAEEGPARHDRRLPRRRADALDPDQGALEHLAALRRRATTPLGGLGLLHLAGQPAAGRAQRGARRRRDVVGAEGLGRDGREARRPSTTPRRTACSGRPTRASATRSPSPPGPATRRPTTETLLRDGPHRDLSELQPAGVHDVPQRLPRRGPRGDPARPLRRARPGPTQ